MKKKCQDDTLRNVFHGVSKILLKMKLTLFVILISFFGAMATESYSQTTKLTLDLKNVKVKDALNVIENRSDFFFLYSEKFIDVNREVNIKVQGSAIVNILDKIFAGTDVNYTVKGRQIVLKTPKSNNIIGTSFFSQQQKTVSGKVTDSSGASIPGVSVVVKGTTMGTITNFDGNYSLTNIPKNTILQFSFVGMNSQEIAVSNRNNINVILKENIVGIGEVVAVGYGTQKKSDLTGSVSSVKSADLENSPATNMSQKIQGKAAGVDITQSGGQPGSTPTIRIRGHRSFSATNDPLYVVDGIPLEEGINDINPDDIESIEILKDAASCAIYGSRGANGVIIVTTKRGTVGKSTVSYSGYYGVTNVTREVDMMDGEQYAEYKRESRRAVGLYTNDENLFDAVELENLANGISYNYQDIILNSGYKTDNHLSFSGGNEKTQFVFSAGYFKEQGTIKNMDYKRYNMRLNLDHQITNWFKVGTSTTISRSIKNSGTSTAMNSALRNSPLGECYDEDGEPVFFPTSESLFCNPIFDTESENCTNESKVNRIFASAYVEADFLKHFKYRMNLGVDNSDTRQGIFNGSYSGANLGGISTASVENTDNYTYTLENILKYSQNFNDKHQIDLTLLQSVQKYQSENYYMSVSDLPYETQKWYNMATANTVNSVTSNLEEWQLASFMGRINYSYDGKYLLQGTLRADGSSRLSPGKKWGYFPSGALGWRITEEPWMKNISWLENFKIRTSYGQTGNTAIDPYETTGILSQTDYVWGDTAAFGYSLSNLANSDLKWETTSTFDAGIDFGFLKGRISGSVDFYRANTKDLLMNRQLPATSGFLSTLENVGSTRNSGVEVNLNAVAIDSSKGFKWTIDVNWYHNKEQIIELYNGTEDDIGNNWFIGHPISVFYDYEKIGIWQTSEATEADSYGFEVGEIKVKDQNGDGIINSDDRIIIGSTVPKWSGGITNEIEYKGFDLSCFVYVRYGSTIYSSFHKDNNELYGRYNNLDVNYWTTTNPTNDNPQPNMNHYAPRYASSAAYFKGTFMKIKNITLGYNLSNSVIRSKGISKIRIYMTADQPFMFTKFQGFDPESSTGTINNSYSPSNKSIIFGLNINF